MTRVRGGLAAAALALAPAAQAATNIIPAGFRVISWPGTAGVLRAGSPWGPGSTLSNPFAPVDGLFRPEMTQWNNGSFWWDQHPSVNPFELFWTVILDRPYTLNRLVVQADNNDSYIVEAWDGARWTVVFDVPEVDGFGLMTRDSGILPAFTTDRLRFRATGGDLYHALSELQAFAVPEPATWAMLIAGFGLVGGTLRRRRALPA
nr:PEPxxWA-CTERM sorting domain-containing protein [Thermaurantiacus tibetensis]